MRTSVSPLLNHVAKLIATTSVLRPRRARSPIAFTEGMYSGAWPKILVEIGAVFNIVVIWILNLGRTHFRLSAEATRFGRTNH
jgi:hypothetical protein